LKRDKRKENEKRDTFSSCENSFAANALRGMHPEQSAKHTLIDGKSGSAGSENNLHGRAL
jgi:hypothetical protein